MVEQKIELRKIRDFGDNINDTFQFIRLNFKPLLKSFFAICAIFMLAQSILQGLVQSRYAAIWTMLFEKKYNRNAYSRQVFGFQYFLNLIIPLVTYVAMQVAVGSYMKFYAENDGRRPGIEDVWNLFKKYFLKILVYSIPVWLCIILGTVLCVVPGVYLWVVLVPFVAVAMMEDTGFIDTFQRCFDLIRENFWNSFGIYFVVIIIYYISSAFVGIVVSGLFGLASYLTTKNLGTTIGIMTSFFSIFSLSFYVIVTVSATLHYFTLSEFKDGVGILGRINELGHKKNNFNDIEEQF